jgi:hypothetical protein
MSNRYLELTTLLRGLKLQAMADSVSDAHGLTKDLTLGERVPHE